MCILLSTAAVIPPLSGKRKGVIAGVFIGILLVIVVIAICVIRWAFVCLQPVTFIIIHFTVPVAGLVHNMCKIISLKSNESGHCLSQSQQMSYYLKVRFKYDQKDKSINYLGSFYLKSTRDFCSTISDLDKNFMIGSLNLYNESCEILIPYIRAFLHSTVTITLNMM